MTLIAAVLGVVVVVVLAFGIAYAVQGYIAPPCDGGYTGIQTFKGHEIQCFYGDVVEVRS